MIRAIRLTEEDRAFGQGYIACLCNVMVNMGGCDADVREAWKAWGYQWKDLKRFRIDEQDMKTLRLYKREILKMHNR